MESSYIIVDYNSAPEVFKKVIETKKLLSSGRFKSVNDVLNKCELSRTAFYKYKNHVFVKEENDNNSIIATLAFTLDDVTGILSEILTFFAERGISVLTINQNIPINGIANITISLRINSGDNVDKLTEGLIGIKGVNKVYILAMS